MSEQAPARVAASSPVFPRQSGAKRLLAAARSNRAFQLTVLLALLLGTWLRLRGYVFDPPTLWLDEAFWAIRILEKPITQCRIRPVGFVYLTKWLVQAFGATETIYRALPCLASLSALWLMPYVAGGLMRRRWVVLLAVFLFAIHPVAIEMSVEFKHYGVEIGIFVVLLAAYVLHRRRQKAWSLALLLGLACLGVLFSFAVIFLYSALFLALAWEAIVRRRWKKLVAVAAGCAACLAAISAMYLLLW